MSQPEHPPRYLLDRSLGRRAVPEALRADGWDLITLAEHYGMPADEQVADTEWIEERDHDHPWLSESITVGLPPFRPCVRAAASPASVRSWIKSRARVRRTRPSS